MNPVWSKASEGLGLHRLLTLLGGLFLAVGLYVLSVGPVFWFYGPEAIPGFGGKPAWIRVVYAPLGTLPRPLLHGLDDYVQWWMNLRKPRMITASA